MWGRANASRVFIPRYASCSTPQENPSMKRILLALALLLQVGLSQAAPPSAESIERLLSVTRTESLIESMYGNMEEVMRQSMKQAAGNKPLTAEQQRVFDVLPARFTALVRQEMSWPKMKPQYVQIYQESFSQEEIDGLIAFYESPAGQAAIAKMPLVMQKSMNLVQQQMQTLMPLMQKMIDDAKKEAKIKST
jgi:hypothetical protein